MYWQGKSWAQLQHTLVASLLRPHILSFDASCPCLLQVSVNNCKVTMSPSDEYHPRNGCPCSWFDASFSGNISITADGSTPMAVISVDQALSTVSEARERINWANNNKDKYSQCFLDNSILSDSQVSKPSLMIVW
jgi:hypothetical protein